MFYIGRSIKEKQLFYLIVIIAFAIIVRLIFGFFSLGSMSMGIASRAYQISQGGSLDFQSLYSFRFALLYPVALLFKIFGINLFSLSFYPFFCSMATIVVVFFLGKILFNEYVGVIAAFLLSFYPLNVVAGTSLYPDGPMAFFMSLSILLYVIGENTTSRKKAILWYFFFQDLC